MSNNGEEEIIIIGGGGHPHLAESTASKRVAHYKAQANADPYELARALIDEAEAFGNSVTFESRKAKG